MSCQQSFDSTKELLRHIQKQHPETDTSEPDIIVQMPAIRKPLNQSTTCPLCKEGLESTNAYQRHVGRHQIELSLFALPRKDDEDDAVEDGDKEEQMSSDESSEPFQSMSVAENDSHSVNLKRFRLKIAEATTTQEIKEGQERIAKKLEDLGRALEVSLQHAPGISQQYKGDYWKIQIQIQNETQKLERFGELLQKVGRWTEEAAEEGSQGMGSG